MAPALTVNPAWLVSVLLLSLRLAAMLVATPLLAAASVPAPIRVLLVVALAAALSLGLPGSSVAVAPSLLRNTGAVFTAALSELALGMTLSLGVLLAFGAFSTAGRLLDVGIGFGLGQVIDPASNTRTPVITSAFNQLGVLVFFLADGHHALLRGFAFSLERFPVGRSWPIEAAVAPMLKAVTALFSLGFALAAPVAFCLLLLELALGVISRNLPQLNMLSLGIPAKVFVGLLALSAWFGAMGGAMTRVYAELYAAWGSFFAAEGP